MFDREAFMYDNVVEIIDHLEQLKDKHLCKLCYVGSIEFIFGCGHVICNDCLIYIISSTDSTAIYKCPYCRKYGGITKIF